MNALAGYRTHILAASGVITAVLAFLAGEMSLAEAVQSALVAASVSTLRVGVANAVK
ncbi:MAG: hypothetical protein ACLGHR_10335 [Gammaproteobacteria bacterium]